MPAWAGASLREVLKRARPLDEGIEVIFWGADEGQVTIRDNTGMTGAGLTGTVEPDGEGGLDLTDHRAVRPQHVPGGRHEPGQPALL